MTKEKEVRDRVAASIRALEPNDLSDQQIVKLQQIARRVEPRWGRTRGHELLYNASLAVTVLLVKDVFLALRGEWPFLDELYMVEIANHL